MPVVPLHALAANGECVVYAAKTDGLQLAFRGGCLPSVALSGVIQCGVIDRQHRIELVVWMLVYTVSLLIVIEDFWGEVVSEVEETIVLLYKLSTLALRMPPAARSEAGQCFRHER